MTDMLVQDVIITKKSAPRVQLIVQRIQDLIEAYPQFAVDSILAKLADWSPSSVFNACEKHGVTGVQKSSRYNRASLANEILNLFFDENVSNEELLEARGLLQGVVSAVSEDILATAETEEDEDPLA